jgi:hypothetical protein
VKWLGPPTSMGPVLSLGNFQEKHWQNMPATFAQQPGDATISQETHFIGSPPYGIFGPFESLRKITGFLVESSPSN